MLSYSLPTGITAFTTERTDVLPSGIILPIQTHSNHVAVVRDSLVQYPDTDALVTDRPGLLIGVRTADCVPVLLCDPVRRVVSAVHAGWRGTVAGITAEAVRVMMREFGSQPSDICAVICPSISPERFEVGSEVVEQFSAAGFPANMVLHTFLKPHIDLWHANRWLLTEMGVPSSQVEVVGLCTYAHTDRFFSARREGISTGRLVSGIMLP